MHGPSAGMKSLLRCSACPCYLTTVDAQRLQLLDGLKLLHLLLCGFLHDLAVACNRKMHVTSCLQTSASGALYKMWHNSSIESMQVALLVVLVNQNQT
jgi:hypothetical protein